MTATIITKQINPPIPSRAFDWVAWSDGDEKHTGFGQTAAEAVANLELDCSGFCRGCGSFSNDLFYQMCNFCNQKASL